MVELDRRSPVVVCAADNNYAMQLAVVVRSAVEHLDGDRRLLIYVIDGGITSRNKAKILRSIDSSRCNITWLQPSLNLLSQMPVSGHITAAAYLRILIPDLLPDAVEKAIYLDSDLIVNADLGKLWDIPLEKALSAVQDFSVPYVSCKGGLSNYRELNLSDDRKYFNSGVLVFDLERWRSENLRQKIFQYIAQNKRSIQLHDQDAMNAVLAWDWQELDPRWNQTPHIFKPLSWQESPFNEAVYKQILQDPYIIHFASAAKPWNSREIYPATDLFFQYVDKTAWAGWRLTRWRRLQNRLLREVKQFRRRTPQWLPI
ncbi:glycosyltransferase family 8 protein [Phormidium tenue FACHB-886]|nr:glycosyltransferase family 8 protein [Phormidium tenue FACHB-886]